MSLFSLVKLVLLFFLPPCIFFFHPFFLLLVVYIWFNLFIKLVRWDLFFINTKRLVGFWLFLLREVIVFVTLLVSCLWFQSYYSNPIAYAYFIPLIESVLLIGSSFFISTYHNMIKDKRSINFLYVTIAFSFVFVFLALYEMLKSHVRCLFNPHRAMRFMTIGLHFSHVIVGTVGLIELLDFWRSSLVRWKRNFIVIYWHFVDYVWLFVFTVVYVLV